MADINSPLGRRQIAMQNPQARRQVYTVPDESGFSASSTDFEEPMNARQQMQDEMQDEPSPAVKRVRQMVGGGQEVSRENLQQMRQQSKSSKMELNPKAKNRLEVLLGLKRKTKDVEVEGVQFSLRTLKHSEYQEVFKSLSRLPETTDILVSLEMQVQILARSITHIDGADIMMVLGVESIDEVVEYIKEFESDVVEELHKQFNMLKKETEVNKEEEGEVVENLKK